MERRVDGRRAAAEAAGLGAASQEATYLARAFSAIQRSRLIRYADLLAYRKRLRRLAEGSIQPWCPPLAAAGTARPVRSAAGQPCGGEPARAGSFLETHFALASRQQLQRRTAAAFNMLLEGG